MELHDGPIALRPWTEEDVPAIHDACQDPDIQHWLPGLPHPYTLDDARAFVHDELGLGPHQFAIVEGGALAGSIGLRVIGNETGSIGYWCVPEYRGRGVVTRALRTVCEFGLDELALERLQLTTDVDNLASQRVAEKVGFRREGVLRSHIRHPDERRLDVVMFSLLPGELSE